jgi:hypothetical protein
MKLFGEYLIEKGVVTEQALLSALVEQIKQTPSVCEIVFHDALVPPAELLKALTIQSKKQISFVDACKELGLWNEQIMESVKTKTSALRTPVGQILVKQGAASFDALTHALDDFLGDIEKPETQAAKVEKTPTEEAQSAPAQTTTPTIDLGIVNDYCEIFSTDKKKELESLASGELNLESLQKINEYFHVIAGAARFIGAQTSEKCLSETEDVLASAIKLGIEKLNPDARKNLTEAIQETTTSVWGLRQVLSESGSEAGFLGVSENAGLLKKLESKIGVLKFDLEMNG